MKKAHFLLSVTGVFSFLLLPFSLVAEMNFKSSFDWKSGNVKSIGKEIKFVQCEFTSPRLIKCAAVRIDLSSPAVRFKVTPRSGKWGEKMPDFPQYTIRTDRKTCRKFMEENIKKGENMVVAVNSSPWSPWQPPWNHPYADRTGLIISDGIPVSPVFRSYPSFAVDKKGKCFFKIFREKDDLSQIRHAVSGFGYVLKNGTVCGKDNGRLAPRTGYGLSSCGKYLILFVCDGRQQEYSMGCSTYETGEFLKYFGASEGLNMDGGGSTTLLVRKGKDILKLNSHRNGAERSVGGGLGIIVDRKK